MQSAGAAAEPGVMRGSQWAPGKPTARDYA